jgi:hypothetical protein
MSFQSKKVIQSSNTNFPIVKSYEKILKQVSFIIFTNRKISYLYFKFARIGQFKIKIDHQKNLNYYFDYVIKQVKKILYLSRKGIFKT